MKKILYLTFYFEPDLCAGSFRNSPLAKELASQASSLAEIDLITTLPNRYSTYEVSAPAYEVKDNLSIYRVEIPKHNSGMKDQILSFKTYFDKVKQIIKGRKYDLVVSSSSRLFTAYLGYSIAKKQDIPLYLDIRDIFYDTLEDVLKEGLIKMLSLPIIKKVESRTFNYASHINLISEGFRPYFSRYKNSNYSYFPNGIDDVFIEANNNYVEKVNTSVKTIVYAGNIGEGQGLHKIIPQAAKTLGEKYKFLIIGDGGAKNQLVEELLRLNVHNVELRDPVKRNQLIDIYNQSDFLFVHLNDFKAFEKVLPSKIFELATFPKPIIAGLSGFSAKFIEENVENSILFKPCDVDELVFKLNNYIYQETSRTMFINKYKRDIVNRNMAETMLNYIR